MNSLSNCSGAELAEVDKSQRPPHNFTDVLYSVTDFVSRLEPTAALSSRQGCQHRLRRQVRHAWLAPGGRALAKQATDVARANPCSVRARRKQRCSSPQRESTAKNRRAQPVCSFSCPSGTITFPVACHLSDRVRPPESASQCRTRLRAGACSTGPASIAQPASAQWVLPALLHKGAYARARRPHHTKEHHSLPACAGIDRTVKRPSMHRSRTTDAMLSPQRRGAATCT